MNKVLEKLEARVKELEDSLKENSWENCDDDEEPNWDKRVRDQSERDGILFAIKIIKESL